MANGNKQKKAGRPPGSANKDYSTVFFTCARCVYCDCTEFTDRLQLPYQNEAPDKVRIAPDGRRYNRVRRVKATCAACGKPHTIYEYQLIPEPEESPAKDTYDAELGSRNNHGAGAAGHAVSEDAPIPGGGGL